MVSVSSKGVGKSRDWKRASWKVIRLICSKHNCWVIQARGAWIHIEGKVVRDDCPPLTFWISLFFSYQIEIESAREEKNPIDWAIRLLAEWIRVGVGGSRRWDYFYATSEIFHHNRAQKHSIKWLPVRDSTFSQFWRLEIGRSTLLSFSVFASSKTERNVWIRTRTSFFIQSSLKETLTTFPFSAEMKKKLNLLSLSFLHIVAASFLSVCFLLLWQFQEQTKGGIRRKNRRFIISEREKKQEVRLNLCFCL